MLILSRKKNEKIIIAGGITVVVVDISEGNVRLGIEAPKDISIHREEIQKIVDGKEELERRKLEVKTESLEKTLDPIEEDCKDDFIKEMTEIRKRAN